MNEQIFKKKLKNHFLKVLEKKKTSHIIENGLGIVQFDELRDVNSGNVAVLIAETTACH